MQSVVVHLIGHPEKSVVVVYVFNHAGQIHWTAGKMGYAPLMIQNKPAGPNLDLRTYVWCHFVTASERQLPAGVVR